MEQEAAEEQPQHHHQMELCTSEQQQQPAAAGAAHAQAPSAVVAPAAAAAHSLPPTLDAPAIAAAVKEEAPPGAAGAGPGQHQQQSEQAAGGAGKRMARSRVGEPAQSTPTLPSPPAPSVQPQHQHLQHLQQQQQQSPLQAPCYQRDVGASMTSLHILGSSQLQPDLLLTNPVVRLHVVAAATGEYVRLSHQLAGAGMARPQQPLSGSGGGDGSTPQRAQHVLSAEQHAQLLDYPGRPCLSTLDNTSMEPKSGLLEHVPPLQTRPADDRSRYAASSSAPGGPGISSSSSGLAALWNEELSIDVPPDALQAADAMLLLEVLQLPGGFQRFQRHASEFQGAGGGHPVAWAFLRLSALQAGKQQQQLQLGQQPLRLRLQLFRYAAGSDGVPWACMLLGGPHPETAAKAAYLSLRQSGLLRSPAHAAGACSSSSPMQRAAGLWSQHAHAAATGAAAAPQPGAAAAQDGPAAAVKYPAFLEVTLAAVPRPAAAVVLTDPPAGVRPVLPAGFGCGFEIGRFPASMLHLPRARQQRRSRQLGAFAGSGAGDEDDEDDDGGGLGAGSRGPLLDEGVLLLERRLHRPHGQPCVVPNALLTGIRGTPGGCSCISFSRDGRWLAAACGDGRGSFRLTIYHALSGRLRCALGSHSGMVHSLSWARDDSALVSAAADLTAKVWHLPQLPGLPQVAAAAAPAGASPAGLSGSLGAAAGSLAPVPCTSTSGAAAITAAAAAAGVSVTVLQHTCFVYAAEQHPLPQGAAVTAVTAGFDGILRLWSMQGVALSSLRVADVPVNCLTFDQLGSRLFVGDAVGGLTEVSLDLTALLAAAAADAQAWSSAAAQAAAAGAGSSDGAIAPCGSPRRALLRGAPGSRPASPLQTQQQQQQQQQLVECAGLPLLKKLRSSQELAGCPILSLAHHPGGHHIVALTRSSKGTSDLVALDSRLLLVARRFGGVRCSSAALHFGLSPDGRYVLCGSEDGSATLWDWDSATPTPLPHLTLGGAPTLCMAWSSCFQAVAVASLGHFAPIHVHALSADRPHVVLNTPPAASAGAAAAPQAARAGALHREPKLPAAEEFLGRPLRCQLPAQLTPSHVHALLSELRASAVQRGLYSRPEDPDGLHLMVAAAAAGQGRRRGQARRLGEGSTKGGGSTAVVGGAASSLAAGCCQPNGVVAA